MDITIFPGTLSGALSVIPSKSMAHRYLICGALSDGPTKLLCPETNSDIEATVHCLNALGAAIDRTAYGYHIQPICELPQQADFNCGESGSTLRFLLPVVGALGINATFRMEGRLPQRPLSPLWEEMERKGCSLTRPDANTIRCTGKLAPGDYVMDGGVSSQFITGLLFGLSLIDGPTDLQITGNIESKPYIQMTCVAMELFHAPNYRSPGTVSVEGDWSNGAFWLAANELGSNIHVNNLNPDSSQGDRIIERLLPGLKSNITIDSKDIPDLVPILAVVAGANRGAVFSNVSRLRLKESDRVESTICMIRSLGGRAEVTENTLIVYGTGFTGGTVDSFNDHRIAMAAAVATTVCQVPVTILGAESVTKSYPTFWDEYRKLGGNYEQHLR